MLRKSHSKAGFIKNMFFSASSIALSIGFMQFVLLPLVSRTMDDEAYGFMLTLVAIVDVFAVTFGGTLCSIRLIKKEKYESISGDFSVLSLVYSALGCIIVIVVCYIFGEKSLLGLALIGVYAFLLFYHSYGSVYFRLKKVFKLELLSAVLMVIGFLLGFVVLKATGVWQFIYIIGYAFAVVYSCGLYGKILKEPFVKTAYFRETAKDSVQLNLSSFLIVLVTYADKLILFKLMGGAIGAVYNAAAIVGKCVALITNPINGLLLSYLSNNKTQTKRYLNYGWVLAVMVAVTAYFLFLFISRPMLNILYPQYCDRAMAIIPYTLGAAMINAIYAMINPFILKALSPRIQIIMNSTSLVVYVVSAYLLYKMWGLIGFCLSLMLAGIIKLCFLLFCTVRINVSTGGDLG